MPPSFVVVLLVALGVPAALRALIGRPHALLAGQVAAATGAVVAQVAGEFSGWRVGVLGDAQLLASVLAAVVMTLVVVLLERRVH